MLFNNLQIQKKSYSFSNIFLFIWFKTPLFKKVLFLCQFTLFHDFFSVYFKVSVQKLLILYQNHYQKQKGSMRFNSQNQTNSEINKKQSFPYFNELSISSIREKNNPDQSLNFENEKQLFNQLTTNIMNLDDQYGLQKASTHRGFVKRLQEEHSKPITFQKSGSNSRLKNIQFQQQNLCFNKQLKRKKVVSKSKQKIIQPSTQLSASRSLKQLKLIRNLNMSNKKASQQYKLSQAKLSIIDIKKMINCPVIALKIYQNPLQSTSNMERKENVKKLYHQMPDDVRLQLNDINYNLNIQPLICNYLGYSAKLDELKDKSSISYSLKRSHLSKPEESRRYKNYQIYLPTTGSQKVIQVKKPLSLDCRNSSFYSTTATQQYQSPISKDSSSTATRRIARRSQLIATSPKHEQEYFSRMNKNINRLYK